MGKLIRRMGIPTFAVSALLLVVLIAAYVMGQSLPVLFTDILRRVGMNGILVLAMVPSIKSGVGPNFALPIGIVGGLFALHTAGDNHLRPDGLGLRQADERRQGR